MNLTKLIRPKSLAIVGASDRPGSIGSKVSNAALKSSIRENTYFINTKKEELLGKPCYQSLSDLPVVVDSIILCTPKNACAAILKEAGELGIGGAIVYAGGFSEENTEEGTALERELIEIARKYDIAMLGPNCNGITNNVDKIYMAMLGYTIEKERPTGIGVISQSGYVTSMTVLPPAMSISYGISVGNGNVVHLEDFLEFMVNDESVHVIAIYLEGVRDGLKFMSMLKKAQEKKKPVVILKTGKSAIGAKAAASHTGSMAGSFARYKSLFQKYNAILTESLQEFIYTALAINVLKKADSFPRGENMAAINLSGAENVLCADMCDEHGLKLANFTEETCRRLEAVLPQFAVVNNPIDGTTYFLEKVPEFVELIRIIADDPGVDMVAVNVEIDAEPDQKNLSEIESMIRARKTCVEKPLFAMCTYEATRNVDCRGNLEDVGIPILGPGVTGYKILSDISRYVAYKPEDYRLEPVVAEGKRTESTIMLTEYETKVLLSAEGITVPWQKTAGSIDELREVLKRAEYPLTIKINSRDIAHKSDAGGVKLNIKNAAQAEAAYMEIMENCAKYDPKARLDGVLVSKMLPSGARELIVGVNTDAALGPFVMTGMGGVYTELFQDISIMPAPVCHEEAKRMIYSLKSAKLLKGYRGGRPADVEALCELIVKVSEMAARKADTLRELDLNPVMVYDEGEGVAIADALAVCKAGKDID